MRATGPPTASTAAPAATGPCSTGASIASAAPKRGRTRKYLRSDGGAVTERLLRHSCCRSPLDPPVRRRLRRAGPGALLAALAHDAKPLADEDDAEEDQPDDQHRGDDLLALLGRVLREREE